MFRRVTCCMIALALVLSLAGCNGKPDAVPTVKGDADPKASAPVGRGGGGGGAKPSAKGND